MRPRYFGIWLLLTASMALASCGTGLPIGSDGPKYEASQTQVSHPPESGDETSAIGQINKDGLLIVGETHLVVEATD